MTSLMTSVITTNNNNTKNDETNSENTINWNQLNLICLVFVVLVYITAQTPVGQKITQKAQEGVKTGIDTAVEGIRQGGFDRNDPTHVVVKGVSVKLVREAILGQESNYNYRAVNPDSRALGFAQIMPFNLPSWSREALGRQVSEAEFLNSPSLQLRIIDYRIAKYLRRVAKKDSDKRIIIARIASLWYSGRSDLINSEKPQYYRTKSGSLREYPSIASYCRSVVSRYLKLETRQQQQASIDLGVTDTQLEIESDNTKDPNTPSRGRGSGRLRINKLVLLSVIPTKSQTTNEEQIVV